MTLTALNPKLTCPHCHQAIPQPSGIIADELRGEIRYNGAVAFVPPAEFELFVFLLARIGRAVTKEGILDELYAIRPDAAPEIKIIDVFVCKLRKKLKPLGLDLKTHWGRGYSLELPMEARETELAMANAAPSHSHVVGL